VIEVDALYKAYRQWCVEGGYIAATRAMFGRDLKSARPEIKRGRPGRR